MQYLILPPLAFFLYIYSTDFKSVAILGQDTSNSLTHTNISNLFASQSNFHHLSQEATIIGVVNGKIRDSPRLRDPCLIRARDFNDFRKSEPETLLIMPKQTK